MGDEVKGFEVGQRVSFGVFSSKCGSCSHCNVGRNDNCMSFGEIYPPGFGGWATHTQQNYEFFTAIPEGILDEHVAPLMCAGMTMYKPLRNHGFPGARIAVNGIGGLGHMGIQYAAHMGMHVTAISTNPDKRQEALDFGAEDFLLSTDDAAMSRAANSFDFVLNSATSLDLKKIFKLVKPRGKQIIVGAPSVAEDVNFDFWDLINGNKQLVGSHVGPVPWYDDMLQMSANLKIFPMVEVVPFTPDSVAAAY
jgi:D-arabinose 1-dehydrogenase-like Zn-dependent alcohol dehydrogenase